MASNPNPPSNAAQPESGLDEKPLTREEWWDLLWSLEGSMKGWFPEEGGPSGILRKEREDWGE
jgi:hypothetical protein